MKALRLLSRGLLDHCSCDNGQCNLIRLCGLDKSITQYVKMLTSAMFYKKRAEGDHWLLVFYSLNIQSYVRLALIAIENQLSGCQIGGAASSLASFGYLHMATTVFNAISAQNNHTLARRLQDTPRKPSAFASVLSLDSLSNQQVVSSRTSPGNWDGWRRSGTEKHLRKIFHIDDSSELLPIDASDDEPDSDDTIMSRRAPLGSRRNRESNGSLLAARKKIHLAAAPERVETPSERSLTPHLSEYSQTSWGSPSLLSSAATETSSLLSLPVTDSDSVYVQSWGAIEPSEQYTSPFQQAPWPVLPPADDKSLPLRPLPSFQCSCCRIPSRFASPDELK